MKLIQRCNICECSFWIDSSTTSIFCQTCIDIQTQQYLYYRKNKRSSLSSSSSNNNNSNSNNNKIKVNRKNEDIISPILIDNNIETNSNEDNDIVIKESLNNNNQLNVIDKYDNFIGKNEIILNNNNNNNNNNNVNNNNTNIKYGVQNNNEIINDGINKFGESEENLKSDNEINLINIKEDNLKQYIENDILKNDNNNNNNNNNERIDVCLMCDLSFNSFTDEEIEGHLYTCIDNFECNSISNSILSQKKIEIFLSQQDNIENDRGLKNSIFYCVVCDIDISRRKLQNRCLHLKQCARIHGIPTKELLQMITPYIDDDDDDDDIDIDDVDNDDIIDTTNTYNNKDIIVIDDDDNNNNNNEAKDENIIENYKSSANIPIPNNKNAMMILMENSRKKTISGFISSPTPSLSNIKSNSISNLSNGIPNAFDSIMSGNKSNYDNNKSSKSIKSGKWGWNSKKVKKFPNMSTYAPAFKQIKVGSMLKPIIVDGFQYSSSSLSDCYFLTHFHSDHYIGLDSSFDSGTIYCTTTTAGLCRLKLGLKGINLIPLALEKTHVLNVGGSQVEVVLMDANHCPGAVVILFTFDNGRKVLHTGDFRWNANSLRTSPTYKALFQCSSASNLKILTVYLDTTYCNPIHKFPLQIEAIDNILTCVRKEIKTPEPLFIFGAYGIGKEKVYMSVAKELNKKVYVDKTRYKMMMCYEWPTEDLAILTTDPSLTNIWVVSMSEINFNSLINIKKKSIGKQNTNGLQYSRIVAFQPTGWSHTSKSNITTNSAMLHPRIKDGNIIYSIPYSEHSSFDELIDFVKKFTPNRIVPTVNCSTPETIKAQIDVLLHFSGLFVKKNPITSIINDSSNNIQINRSEFS